MGAASFADLVGHLGDPGDTSGRWAAAGELHGCAFLAGGTLNSRTSTGLLRQTLPSISLLTMQSEMYLHSILSEK
jgi:hypothetical protein